MTSLYVDFDEWCEESGIGAEEDGGAWSYRGTSIYNFELREIRIAPFPMSITKEVPFDVVRGQTVYIVLARYSTGDSFGNSEGHGCIVGIYKNEKDAQAIIDSVSDETYYEKVEKYPPWKGYFESLQDIFVESKVVM